MKVFIADRTDKCSWVEDYKMVIVANDEEEAETMAIEKSEDFTKTNTRVKEVDTNVSAIISIENTGA